MSLRLYAGAVETFARDLDKDRLIPTMQREFSRQMLQRPSPSEVTSWANSLPVLRDDLLAADLERASVVLESILPLSSKRLDAVILGHDSSGQAGAVVIELKQWRRADVLGTDDRVVNLGGRLVLHPQQQVAQYVQYLRDFHTMVELNSLAIDGGAYLHNADAADAEAMNVSFLDDLVEFPLFTGDERDSLQSFLHKRTHEGATADLLSDYLSAPMRPSTKLLQHVALEIQGQEMFHLLDEQLVAFEIVKKAVTGRRTRTP